MARGFVYLAVVQSAGSVVARVDHPGCGILRRDVGGGAGQARQAEIFNTDQGSQFTGAAFTGLLIKNGIAISMDGKVHGETTSSSNGCGAA